MSRQRRRFPEKTFLEKTKELAEGVLLIEKLTRKTVRTFSCRSNEYGYEELCAYFSDDVAAVTTPFVKTTTECTPSAGQE